MFLATMMVRDGRMVERVLDAPNREAARLAAVAEMRARFGDAAAMIRVETIRWGRVVA